MSSRLTSWLVLGLGAAAFLLLMADVGLWERVLRFLFPHVSQVLHPRASPLLLVVEHMRLVGVSSGLTILVGLPLGIWVTRPSGRAFLPLANDLTALSQTFPPVAVLALAVPLLGFGFGPTVAALFLYGLLPVVRNTIAGLQSVPADVRDAARGMGLGRLRMLARIELPLAAPAILAGVRTSVIINIGTAMVGAVIGAGGLGSPIVAGLVQDNLAFVLEGAIPGALLAVLADQALANLEASLVFRAKPSK